MGVFTKTKKYRKSSKDLVEKLKVLEKEEKKNISEITMSTSGMYSEVEPVPEVPPVPAEYTDVPDPTGFSDPNSSWEQPGDESDTSTWDEEDFDNTTLYKDQDDFLRNPNPLPNGQPAFTPITATIDEGARNAAHNSRVDNNGDPVEGFYPGGCGLAINGNYYGTAVGYIGGGRYRGVLSGGLTGGTNVPTEASRGWGGSYRNSNDAEFAFAVSTWNIYNNIKQQYGNNLVTRLVKVWVPYNHHHHYQRGGNYATWTLTPKSQNMIVESVAVIIGVRNQYISKDFEPHIPAWNKVLRQGDLGDAEEFPGPIKLMEDLFGASPQALESMLDQPYDVAAEYGGSKAAAKRELMDYLKRTTGYESGKPLGSGVPGGNYGKDRQWTGGVDLDRASSDVGGSYNEFGEFVPDLGVKGGDELAWGGGNKPAPTPTRKSDFGAIKKQTAAKDAYMSANGMGMSPEAYKKKYGISPQGFLNLPENKTYDFDKDPLVKKSDAFGLKQKPNDWFNLKDVHPEYPDKPAPKLKNGWHPKSRNLIKSKRFEKIRVTSKDLLRNYKVSPQEIKDYHMMVKHINLFIENKPGEAAVIADRYPAHDPRLAELNFKIDTMMNASAAYVAEKFPENQKVTSRIVKILKKTVEMTDPKSFKMDPTPPKQLDYDKLKLRETATKHFKKPVQLKSWHKGHLTNA